MHLQATRTASPSPNEFRPAYNLFRRKGHPHLFCAVPEDHPVPAFVDGHGWTFAGKVEAAPVVLLGFESEEAKVVVRLTGFYLFTAIQAEQPIGDAQHLGSGGRTCDVPDRSHRRAGQWSSAHCY